MRTRGEPSFPARLAMTGLAVLIACVLYLARRALLLVYLSALLAIALSPLVRLVERYPLRSVGRVRLPRWLAILVIYVAVLGVVAGIASLVVPPLFAQGRQFVAAVPDLLKRAERVLVARGVPPEVLSWQSLADRVGKGDVVANVTGTVSSVVGGALGVLVVGFLTFYLLVDSEQLFAELLRFFPLEKRRQAERSARQITTKLSGWLGGHALLGTIVGGATALVLGLLGEPYFYVLALIAFLGEFLPYLGPLLAATAAIGVAATVSWTLMVEVAALWAVIGLVEGNVLAPRVFERQVGLGAPTIIVALLIGSELAGVLGAVLAIPTAAILQVIVEEVLFQDDASSLPAPADAAPAAPAPAPRPGRHRAAPER